MRQEGRCWKHITRMRPCINVPRSAHQAGANAAIQKGFTLEHALKNLLDKDTSSHFTEFWHAEAHSYE